MFKFLTAFTCLLVILLLSTSPGFTSDSDTLLRIGLEKSNSGDYRGALIEFSRAIEVEPNNASAFHYRGVAKARFGDFEASIIDYNEAIKLDSSEVSSLEVEASPRQGPVIYLEQYWISTVRLK